MEEGSYTQSLGQLELMSLGTGSTIGSGIFVTPRIASGIIGLVTLITQGIVAVSAILVTISLKWVSARFGRSGTFFTTFSSQFGRKHPTMMSAAVPAGSPLK